MKDRLSWGLRHVNSTKVRQIPKEVRKYCCEPGMMNLTDIVSRIPPMFFHCITENRSGLETHYW